MSSVVSAAVQRAALDSTRLPYEEIRVLMLDWLKDDVGTHGNVFDLQLAWMEWGAVVKRANERTYGSQVQGKWAAQSPFDVCSEWLGEEDGMLDDGRVEVEESMVRKKLLVFCYFGHGFYKNGRLFALRQVNGDQRTKFNLTKLQHLARDTIGRCDILFYLDCCDSDFDGMTLVEELDDCERANASIKMETLTAGMGEIRVSGGGEDFARRFAANLREHREPMSVEDRFNLIKREMGHETPGFLRQDSGEGSIVLAATNS